MRKTALLLVLLSLIAAGGVAQVADGDQHWAQRAEGHSGGRARPAQIDAAIAAYQKAIAQTPNDLAAHWKLLRAMRFKGAYVAATNEEKKAIFAEAKKAGERAMALVDKQLIAKAVASPKNAKEPQVANAARGIDGAGELYFWDSANWGEWALAYGKMAAVRAGAADVIRREATIAMLIDPKLEGGGGARVLGRLHDQTPHVPFITGWASEREAVKFLTASLKADPTNKVTKVFLAEAMKNDDSGNKAKAIQMLREVVAAPNDSAYEVEQARAVEDAKELLQKWS